MGSSESKGRDGGGGSEEGGAPGGGASGRRSGRRKRAEERAERRRRAEREAEMRAVPNSRYGSRRAAAKARQGPSGAQRLPAFPKPNSRLKLLKLARCKDWLELQKEFLYHHKAHEHQQRRSNEDHIRILVDLIRGSPLGVFNLDEFIGDDHAIISGTGGEFYCRIHSVVDKDALEPNCSVLVSSKSPPTPDLFIVGVLGQEMESSAKCLVVEKAPSESFRDIGGLDDQIAALKEAVEIPLLQPELFDEMGVTAPRGVILYGPPGTGKTLLAKAVANKTDATFIRCVGSELIQRHAGEGPKLVREMFRLADALAPTIIFLDEIDAVGTKRYDTSCSGEREVQRTLLELLNQLDGFASRKDVKIIMATNRIDSLDTALIRPGRIDRKIEIPLPGPEQVERIFRLLTARMNLAPDVTFSALGLDKKELSGADVKSGGVRVVQALCTEAGMRTLRERRTAVSLDDFTAALHSILATKAHSDKTSLYT